MRYVGSYCGSFRGAQQIAGCIGLDNDACLSSKV